MTGSILTTDSGKWTLVDPLPESAPQAFFEEAMRAARRAKENAYAPYSGFLVGASALMNGTLFSGCNVENASYGGTICAERSAIFSGVADGQRSLQLIALTTSCDPGAPMENRSPCGICRQVMAEFADPETILLLDAGSSEETEFLGEVISFDSLLPLRFRLS